MAPPRDIGCDICGGRFFPSSYPFHRKTCEKKHRSMHANAANTYQNPESLESRLRQPGPQQYQSGKENINYNHGINMNQNQQNLQQQNIQQYQNEYDHYGNHTGNGQVQQSRLRQPQSQQQNQNNYSSSLPPSTNQLQIQNQKMQQQSLRMQQQLQQMQNQKSQQEPKTMRQQQQQYNDDFESIGANSGFEGQSNQYPMGGTSGSKPQSMMSNMQQRERTQGFQQQSQMPNMDQSGGVPLGLTPCRFCGRSFAQDRIQKHESVCQQAPAAKNKMKRRKVFDARIKRAPTDGTGQGIGGGGNMGSFGGGGGTGMNSDGTFAMPPPVMKFKGRSQQQNQKNQISQLPAMKMENKPLNTKWRQESESFRNMIKEARRWNQGQQGNGINSRSSYNHIGQQQKSSGLYYQQRPQQSQSRNNSYSTQQQSYQQASQGLPQSQPVTRNRTISTSQAKPTNNGTATAKKPSRPFLKSGGGRSMNGNNLNNNNNNTGISSTQNSTVTTRNGTNSMTGPGGPRSSLGGRISSGPSSGFSSGGSSSWGRPMNDIKNPFASSGGCNIGTGLHCSADNPMVFNSNLKKEHGPVVKGSITGLGGRVRDNGMILRG